MVFDWEEQLLKLRPASPFCLHQTTTPNDNRISVTTYAIRSATMEKTERASKKRPADDTTTDRRPSEKIKAARQDVNPRPLKKAKVALKSKATLIVKLKLPKPLPPPNSLLGIPPELRTKTYNSLFLLDKTITVSGPTNLKGGKTGISMATECYIIQRKRSVATGKAGASDQLLRCCKQIYMEAKHILYERDSFGATSTTSFRLFTNFLPERVRGLIKNLRLDGRYFNRRVHGRQFMDLVEPPETITLLVRARADSVPFTKAILHKTVYTEAGLDILFHRNAAQRVNHFVEYMVHR